jgi:hypothetical protein
MAWGLVYNGAAFGNTPTQILVNFDQGVTGVGAYIQSNYYGPFTATIELFDSTNASMGTYSTGGTALYASGTALFIGAFVGPDGPDAAWAASFNAVGIGPYEPDFAIGTMSLNSAIPEPGTFLLIAPALIGLAAWARRRKA